MTANKTTRGKSKRLPAAPPTPEAAWHSAIDKLATPKRMTQANVQALAGTFLPTGVRVLALVAAKGKSEAARVAAVRALYEIAMRGGGASDPLAPMGKKEAANLAAEHAGDHTGWADDLHPRTRAAN